MNREQELWWTQAASDHSVFLYLRRAGIPECHLLYYLQIATGKIGKAYLWRAGHAPPKTHIGFVRFLRALPDRRRDLDRIAGALGFGRGQDLDNWVCGVLPLAIPCRGLRLPKPLMVRIRNTPGPTNHPLTARSIIRSNFGSNWSIQVKVAS